MTEPIEELLEWLHTFDDLQFSCNHRNVIEKIWQIKNKKQFSIHSVSKSVNCEHPMESRADINNSRQTYCLKCSTFL